MVKTVWHCDDCGAAFNSRAARLYHRNHTCPKIKDAEEKTEGKEVLPDDFVVRNEVTASGDESNETDGNGKSEDGNGITEATTPDNVERELGTGYLIVSDNDAPAKGEDIPMAFVIPVMILIAFLAAIVIFREKILNLFSKPPQPPAANVDMGFL